MSTNTDQLSTQKEESSTTVDDQVACLSANTTTDAKEEPSSTKSDDVAVEQIANFSRFKFVDEYKYDDKDKIENCSTGMLLHRLRDHILDIVDKRFNHTDNYCVLFNRFVFPLFCMWENFYYFPREYTKEFEIVENVLNDNKLNSRTFKANFMLGSDNIRSSTNADTFLIALVDAIDSRADFFANRRFGKEFERTVRETDPKTKKVTTVIKKIDGRTYNGLLSSGIYEAFMSLDELHKEARQSKKALNKMFGELISQLSGGYQKYDGRSSGNNNHRSFGKRDTNQGERRTFTRRNDQSNKDDRQFTRRSDQSNKDDKPFTRRNDQYTRDSSKPFTRRNDQHRENDKGTFNRKDDNNDSNQSAGRTDDYENTFTRKPRESFNTTKNTSNSDSTEFSWRKKVMSSIEKNEAEEKNTKSPSVENKE